MLKKIVIVFILSVLGCTSTSTKYYSENGYLYSVKDKKPVNGLVVKKYPKYIGKAYIGEGKTETNYINGKADGISKIYVGKKLFSIQNYKNGLLNGECIDYNKDDFSFAKKRIKKTKLTKI